MSIEEVVLQLDAVMASLPDVRLGAELVPATYAEDPEGTVTPVNVADPAVRFGSVKFAAVVPLAAPPGEFS